MKIKVFRIIGILWNIIPIVLGILLVLGIVPDNVFLFLFGVLVIHACREIIRMD